MELVVANVRKVSDKLVTFDLSTSDGLEVRNCRYFPQRESVAGPSRTFVGSDGNERSFTVVRFPLTWQVKLLEAVKSKL